MSIDTKTDIETKNTEPRKVSVQILSFLLTLVMTGLVVLLCYVMWRLTATVFRGTFLGEFRFIARLTAILLLLILLNPIITKLQQPLYALLEKVCSRLVSQKTGSQKP